MGGGGGVMDGNTHVVNQLLFVVQYLSGVVLVARVV